MNWIFNLKKSEDDVSQFDTKFTKQAPIDSPVDTTLSESANMVFVVSCQLITNVTVEKLKKMLKQFMKETR